MRYLQRLNTLPPDEADSPLILGTALHTGIEESLEAAVKKYCSSYPIITDEHINEVIKLEHVIPLARAGIPPGGAFEVPIMDKDFVGYIDYLVPINKVDGTEYFDLYDFKYSNNVQSYKKSNQLHLYKYFFERDNPGKKIRNLYLFFVPKVQIRQKKGETLLDFRERLKDELAGICALDLKELGDRFKTAEMFGKLANIGDDIGDEFIANPAVFKKLVTGDRVSAERKGQNPFEFNNYSKLLFSANQIPRIKDKTGAVQRRLVIIPFDANFSKDKAGFDPTIKHKLKSPDTMEYLINLGLAGLKRILENRGFTDSDKVKKALDEYEEDNNPILGFFKECEDEDFHIEDNTTDLVYSRYQEYCLANNLQAMSKTAFSRQIARNLHLHTEVRRIGKKTARFYVAGDQK